MAELQVNKPVPMWNKLLAPVVKFMFGVDHVNALKLDAALGENKPTSNSPGKLRNSTTFPSFLRRKKKELSRASCLVLIRFCLVFLFYEVTRSSAPFDLKLHENPTIEMLLPEMIHVMTFLGCYVITLVFAVSITAELVVKMFLMFVSFFAPLCYFPNLERKASGFYVHSGSLKIPLIWFSILGALCLFLIFAFMVLLLLCYYWLRLQRGTRNEEEGLDEYKFHDFKITIG